MTDAELIARLRANVPGFRTLQAHHGPLRVRELPGVKAFALPERADSLFQHQVLYEDARALAAALGAVEAWYREQGVRAWRVPVYTGDVAAEAELARAGYRPGEALALPAMGLPLASPPPPYLPVGTTLEHPEHLDEVLTLNGLCFGEESVAHLETWRTRLPPARVHAVLVREAGRALAGGLSFEQEDTAGIYLVATHPGAHRKGLGTLVMRGLHADAHARGCTAAVLLSSPMGHGLYQRLGYRDLGTWTSWVRRVG